MYRGVFLFALILTLTLSAGCKKDEEKSDEDSGVDASPEALCEVATDIMGEKAGGKECPKMLEEVKDEIEEKDWDEFAECVHEAKDEDKLKSCMDTMMTAMVEAKSAGGGGAGGGGGGSSAMSIPALCSHLGTLGADTSNCETDYGEFKAMLPPALWDEFATCLGGASSNDEAQGCFAILP